MQWHHYQDESFDLLYSEPGVALTTVEANETEQDFIINKQCIVTRTGLKPKNVEPYPNYNIFIGSH